MICCLVLADSIEAAKNILFKINIRVNERNKFNLVNDSRVIIVQHTELAEAKVAHVYELVLRRLEIAIQSNNNLIPINEVTVITNRVDNPERLKVTTKEERFDNNWENLLGMMILTFPEIRWIFLGNTPVKSPELSMHTIEVLDKPLREPLCDPTGLRKFVRKNSSKSLPLRTSRAAAIDEETSYALFHAYTAYRFGYLADPVRSWELMNYFFGKRALPKHGYQLLLEDVNLSFPDNTIRNFSDKSDESKEVHLSNFGVEEVNEGGDLKKTGRACHCPRLTDNPDIENSDFRIIVSGGHFGAGVNKVNINLEFIKRYKGLEKSGFVLKPVGGMFDLWAQAKLFKRLPRRRDKEGNLIQKGHAPGFYWPPQSTNSKNESHSAPGKLMLIAQHLVRRADAMRSISNTVEECIHGAVLATDALELLSYQTPTLALQALCLKHEFEVKAEVAFLGVGHHFDLRHRLEELEREVKAASRFFDKSRCRSAELDTLVSIGNRLMLVFREAGQFDEEMACLVRIRSWHRKLRRKQARNPLSLTANGVMGYAEWLLASPVYFFGALLFWYLLLVTLWSGVTDLSLLQSLSISWNAFTAGEPKGIAENPTDFLLHVFGSSVGIFHFGVFISYLYSAVTRK